MDEREISDTLFNKLKEIHDDRDFILGVMSFASHVDDRKKILDFIDVGNEVTEEGLLLLSLWLSNQHLNA